MINILESIFSSNSDFLHSVGEITLVLSLVPLVIFASLAIKSKSIKSFQSQISVFIAVYVVGEILESNNGIAIFSKLSQILDLSSMLLQQYFLLLCCGLDSIMQSRVERQ